jgi:hypothetical protein
MTIAIGLIPNEKTIMLIQDSEASYTTLGFTQDIMHKIKVVNDAAVVGLIGNASFANEIVEAAQKGKYEEDRALCSALEEAYHKVREEKLAKGVLRTYGFQNMREFSQTTSPIDPMVREQVMRAVNNPEGFGVELMLATNLKQPHLYRVHYPGTGMLENNVKMYQVSGSGAIMAIDKMGEELERYRWHKELSIDEGIDVLMRAGKASEKHTGVGGPFEIAYITRGDDGKTKVVKPDQKKINMVMYLFPLSVDPKVLLGCIEQMRDDKVKAEDLADNIRKNVQVGVEFNRYFGLS